MAVDWRRSSRFGRTGLFGSEVVGGMGGNHPKHSENNGGFCRGEHYGNRPLGNGALYLSALRGLLCLEKRLAVLYRIAAGVILRAAHWRFAGLFGGLPVCDFSYRLWADRAPRYFLKGKIKMVHICCGEGGGRRDPCFCGAVCWAFWVIVWCDMERNGYSLRRSAHYSAAAANSHNPLVQLGYGFSEPGR